MIESLKAFFARHAAPPPPSAGETAPGAGAGAGAGAVTREPAGLRMAACALMLELAYADQEFSATERAHVERSLAAHFALEPARVAELIALADAERRRAVDLHQFTSVLIAGYDEGQRLLLAELLWRVVHADGEVSRHEDYLMQKLSRLLDLRPGYLAEARRRAGGGA